MTNTRHEDNQQPLPLAEVAEILNITERAAQNLLDTNQLNSFLRSDVEAYRIAQEFANERLTDYSPIGTQFQEAYREFVGRLREGLPGPTEFISTPRESSPWLKLLRIAENPAEIPETRAWNTIVEGMRSVGAEPDQAAAAMQFIEEQTQVALRRPSPYLQQFPREAVKSEVYDWKPLGSGLLNTADRIIIDQNDALGKWLQKIPNGTFTREDIEQGLEADDGTVSFKGLAEAIHKLNEDQPKVPTMEDLDALMEQMAAYWLPKQKGAFGGVLEHPIAPWPCVSSDGGPELISIPEGSSIYPSSLNELANMFRITKEQIGEPLNESLVLPQVQSIQESPTQTTWQEDDLLVIDLPREQSDEERVNNTYRPTLQDIAKGMGSKFGLSGLTPGVISVDEFQHVAEKVAEEGEELS